MRSSSSWFVYLGAALLVAAGLSGCSDAEGGDGATPTTPTTPTVIKPPVFAALGTPKALFVAIDATPADGDAPREMKLMKVEQDDTFADVPFVNEDQAPVAVEVTRVEALSESYFALELSYSNGTDKRALLRVADGRLFDISDYDVAAAQEKGGYLFTMGKYSDPNHYSYTLFRIDLAATPMTATALNNPAYDPIWYRTVPFLVDADLDVRIELDFYSTKTFFADNSPPFAEMWNTGGRTPLFCPTGGASGQIASVYGEDGKVYAVCVSDVPDILDATTRYLEYYVATVDFTKSGTVITNGPVLRTTTCTGATPQNIPCPEGNFSPAPTTPYRLQNRSRYLPITSGFYTMSPTEGGGITLTWTELPLPAITVISDEYGYRIDGESIKRIRFAEGATEEVVVTAANIIGWKVANGVLIYTKYITGTDIGTYKVSTPGAAPELLLNEDMQVRDIIEL